MKVTKSGKLKLDAHDFRYGNFVVTFEPGYIKLQDINSVFVLRVSRQMPLGIWLENIVEMGEGAGNTISTYAGVMWGLLSVAPDGEMVGCLIKTTEEALKRHPDWYGYDMTDDDKANDEAAREVKEMTEFEEEVKNLTEDEKEGSE